MSYYTNEDRINIETNKQETLLLQELPTNQNIVDIINDNYSILSDFEARKMTYVIKSKLLGEPIVIKMRQKMVLDKDDDHFNEVIHEAFIGLYGTNTLDSKNFAKIITANPSETCLSEFYNSDKIRYTYEQKEDISQGKVSCSYVIYEYIPGITLEEFLVSVTNIQNLKDVYWRLFQALYKAYKEIDFTHYDLHPLNVIVKDDLTPVIIDYGSSHIKYKEKDYGKQFRNAFIRNKSCWQHDIFRLIWSALLETDEYLSLMQFHNINWLQHPRWAKSVPIEKIREAFNSVKQEIIQKGLIEKDGENYTVMISGPIWTGYSNEITYPISLFQERNPLGGKIFRQLLDLFITQEKQEKFFRRDNFRDFLDFITSYDLSFDKFMTLAEPLLT